MEAGSDLIPVRTSRRLCRLTKPWCSPDASVLARPSGSSVNSGQARMESSRNRLRLAMDAGSERIGLRASVSVPGPQIAAWRPGAPSTLPRRSSCAADEKDGMPGREIAAAELSAAPARPAPVRLRPPAGRLLPSAPGSFFSPPLGCCCWPGAMRYASDRDLRCSVVAIATARRGKGESLGSAVMLTRPRSVAYGGAPASRVANRW